MSDSEDRLVAALLEEISHASGIREAVTVLLATALTGGPFRRGAVALRRREGGLELHGAIGEADARPGPVEVESESLSRALGDAEPVLLSGASEDALPFDPCVVLPFADGGDVPLGGLLLRAEALDEEARRLARAVRRCGPALHGLRRSERLRARAERLERERALLARIQDELIDPVILTDARNDIVVANRRAMDLFTSQPGDSVGRARAVRTNTFLFSAFLTQERMAGEAGASRELNLVDPTDGSDLLFEVLTTVFRPEGSEGGHVISVLRDITDLKRAVNEVDLEYRRSRAAEHRARRETQRLNAIIENAAEPILVTDGQSNIVLMNAEAERLFDLPQGLSEGDRRRRLWANVTRFTSLVNEFLLQGRVRREERLSLTDPATGGSIPVEAVNTKILGRLDEPVAVVTVLRDLTQERENERLAEELRSLNEKLEERIEVATAELAERNRLLVWQSQELEKASRLKSEFLARMSHELRTPINAMLGYTSLLREGIYGDPSAEQGKALEKIRSASEHLLTLISEILDLSKIEAGKMPVRLAELRVEELVTEVANALGPLFDEKGLEFRVELEDGLPLVRTDATKLRQVLLNLLENALKYTPEGWVALRTRVEGDRLRFEVEDTGIGIGPEDREVIFEDFRQADQSPTREYGGTGLGLSISRKLLALLGGSISLQSAVGEGSTFTVELPVRADPGSVDEQTRRVLIESARSGLVARSEARGPAGPGAADSDPENGAGAAPASEPVEPTLSESARE